MNSANIASIPTPQVKVIYYGDPICSTCWINEPFIRKFRLEYGQHIELEYRMGGLLESIEAFQEKTQTIFEPKELKNLWDETGKSSGMSMAGDIWMEEPLQSSYPPSIAYYAAQQQGDELALNFLRMMREMLFLQKKDISRDHIILTAARLSKLNVTQFMADFQDTSCLQKLQRDIKDKKKWSITMFPTLVFVNEAGDWLKIEDAGNYDDWEMALAQLTNGSLKKNEIPTDPIELIEHFGYLASKELAVLLNEEITVVDEALEQLYLSGELIKEKYLHCVFWRKKESPFSISRKVNKDLRALVIGGGIAGLSTAINLKKVGFKPYIFERSPATRSNGLGFIMLQNGIDAFELMGLKSQMIKLGHPLNYFVAVDPKGKVLHQSEVDSCIALNRDHCIDMLKGELDNDSILYNKAFSKLHYNGEGQAVGVHFQDGSYEQGDIIVGADGIHSQVRQALYPNHPLTEVGYKEIVCMTHMPELDGEIYDTFYKVKDKGKSMGIIPFGQSRFIWFLQFDSTKFPLLNNDLAAKKDFSMEMAKDWPMPFQHIIQQSNFEQAYLWNIKKMDILPAFHKSGVALLGDAAHPLISFTSQGANSALEDGVLFSHFLSKKEELHQMKQSFQTFNDYRYDVIDNYIKEGDKLLNQFLNPSLAMDATLPFTMK